MSTFTDKLMLRQPERGVDGASDDVVDVNTDVNANMDTIDKYLACEVVTSSTIPPVGKFTGQFAFETDTKYVKMWDGSLWVTVGADKFAKGKVEIASRDTDSTFFTSGIFGPDQTITFTARSDRRYMVEWHFWLKPETSGDEDTINHAQVRWAAGATVTSTDSIIGEEQLAVLRGSFSIPNHYHSFWQTGTGFPDGQITMGTFIRRSGDGKSVQLEGIPTDGSTDIGRVRHFLVRDNGN